MTIIKTSKIIASTVVATILAGCNSIENSNTKLLQEAFVNVIEDITTMENTYAKYFSKDYIQYVDGKVLDYNDFVKHMQAQKQAVTSIKVTFKHIVAAGDKVSTVHMAEVVKKDGSLAKLQVNAFFKIRNNKIILCDELTHLINGDDSDKTLGSRLE